MGLSQCVLLLAHSSPDAVNFIGVWTHQRPELASASDDVVERTATKSAFDGCVHACCTRRYSEIAHGLKYTSLGCLGGAEPQCKGGSGKHVHAFEFDSRASVGRVSRRWSNARQRSGSVELGLRYSGFVGTELKWVKTRVYTELGRNLGGQTLMEAKAAYDVYLAWRNAQVPSLSGLPR